MIRLFCGVLVLLLLANSTQAQNTHKDSCSILEKNFSSAIAKHAFQEAQVTLNQLRSLSKTLNGDTSYMYLSTYLKQGQIEILKGNWNLAIALFLKTKKLLIAYQPHRKESIISVYNGLGNLYTFKNVLDSALYYHNIALEQRIALFGANSLKIATSYNNLAALYLRKKKYQLTINYFRKEVTTYLTNSSSKPEDIARTYNNIARTYILKHQQDSALYYYQKALRANTKDFESTSINTLPGSNQVFFNLSIAFETLFRKSELLSSPYAVIKHLNLADKLAKKIKQQLTYRAEKVRFLRRSGAFFEAAIHSIYNIYQATTSENSKQEVEQLFFYFSERAKANVLLDQISKSSEKQIPIISLSKLQKELRPDQVLLEFTHAKTNLYVMAITNDKVVIKNLMENITREQWQEQVNDYRFACRDIDVEDFIKTSPKLYSKLIAPLKQVLTDKKRIIIIPTSETVNLPFETLMTNTIAFNAANPFQEFKKARYLLNNHIISYHVSSTLAFNRAHKSNYQLDYLGMGFNHFFHPKYQDLKHSETEVSQGLNYFKKTKVYLGHKQGGKDKLSPVSSRIIHLSSHGDIQNGRLIGLIFPKGAGQLDTLGIADVYDLNIQSELTILSGCHSGAGKLIRSEGVYGFTHAFLYANTPSLIYSIWEASDAGSNQIMKLFYHYLATSKNQRDYNKALTLAKRAYASKYPLPANWANFVINTR